ncbi:MAG: bifunctional folylpolyglutamate synthase/ dihydrofolate synthase [Micavibrio sp.]|nr:bifunctional folylpolyglutamate synthase/ dihydrofolate synthase [Micavibrio sp.]|tara:strand:- start:4535 stop:5878 length:1344 start_codon:yes stop_codon:yes gene_type:complete
MYKADLKHPSQSLQKKLETLYALNRGVALDLSFRPPYLSLLEKFGNPHLSLPPVIHVAGTNGKGSIIATLKAIYEAAGYSVHAYTSPHLHRFNERIVLCGQTIDNTMLEQLIDEAIMHNANAPITFFEITTAMAFAAFSRTKADLLLLEVGLGGRLDCTNIISKPNVSIINSISWDHTDFLGDTLDQIAQEKAGIIKYETPCIVGYQMHNSAPKGQMTPMDRIVEEAEDKKAPLFRAKNEWSCDKNDDGMTFTYKNRSMALPCPNLLGNHQVHNAGAALAAIKVLGPLLPVQPKDIETGLRNIVWPGRLERIQNSLLLAHLPKGWELWYDGGHNESAGSALARQLEDWNADNPMPTHLILGMKGDKNPAGYLKKIIPQINSLSLTRVNDIGSCITSTDIEPILESQHVQYIGESEGPKQCLARLTEHYKGAHARVIICGSLYLAEQI